MSKCKTYDSKFKAEVALQALDNSKSLVEIGSERNVPKTTIIEWRDRLISNASELFLPPHERDRQVRSLKQEIELLHKMIGEITIENSFLKKKLMR